MKTERKVKFFKEKEEIKCYFCVCFQRLKKELQNPISSVIGDPMILTEKYK